MGTDRWPKIYSIFDSSQSIEVRKLKKTNKYLFKLKKQVISDLEGGMGGREGGARAKFEFPPSLQPLVLVRYLIPTIFIYT